jgi:hypothetical protein
MINIYLAGKHSNRIPISYLPYRKLLSKKRIFIVDDMKAADILVLGFDIDLNEVFTDYIKIKKNYNRDLKICILSEEPLWDTVWSKNYINNKHTHKYLDDAVDCFYLNHFNSDLFSYKRVPYFITTDDKFFIRYSNLFQNYSKYSISDLKNLFSRRSYNITFMFEKRLGPEYNVRVGGKLVGLSGFRSELASQYLSEGKALIFGKGWGQNTIRQQETDWHLSKLVRNRDNTIIFAAIENTHHKNYITEKIFDSYATLSIPTYYSETNLDETPLGFGKSTVLLGEDNNLNKEVILNCLNSWENKLDNYLYDLHKLSILFSDFDLLEDERLNFISKLNNNLIDILNN